MNGVTLNMSSAVTQRPRLPCGTVGCPRERSWKVNVSYLHSSASWTVYVCPQHRRAMQRCVSPGARERFSLLASFNGNVVFLEYIPPTPEQWEAATRRALVLLRTL